MSNLKMENDNRKISFKDFDTNIITNVTIDKMTYNSEYIQLHTEKSIGNIEKQKKLVDGYKMMNDKNRIK